MQRRDYTLDVLRILACCMIVTMHSPMPNENAVGAFLLGLSYFTIPGIGLFFMVSGALLLPVNTDYFSFIRRRLSKIVVPTLFWTAIYLTLKLYSSESEINLFKTVLSIPFSAQGHGVLWFMYTLTSLYLVAPIIGTWLKNAKVTEIECVLLLWGITLCYPILEIWLNINSGTSGILYYFTGYVGYFILGYYLQNYSYRFSSIIPVAISMIGFSTLVFLKAKFIDFDFYRIFGYESIFMAALSCLIWIILSRSIRYFQQNVKCIPMGGGKLHIISELSTLSFGVYLIHILIMRDFLWKMPLIMNIENYIIQTIVIAILTITLSYGCSVIISNLPFASWLIGYKQSK